MGPSGDHPRVCGEKVRRDAPAGGAVGSPPRMRGKAKELPPRQCYLGITPAYAGKSTRPFSSGHENGDHPRVCGEKQKTPPWGVEKGGSPPRMRGKGVQPRDKRVAVRITPAYAGKRLKRSHRIGHFSCILCLFHSVLHRASASGGSRAGPCAPPCLPAQNAVPV
jgi:hypothetical protein